MDVFGWLFVVNDCLLPPRWASLRAMIRLTRLNGVEFYLNPHQIESIEANPDTTILMLSGKHIIVRESIDAILRNIIEYRKEIGGFKNEE